MKCSRCPEPLDGVYVRDVDGNSHPRCYDLAHPYQPKTTLAEVVDDAENGYLSRQLCVKYMPPEQAAFVVDEFNRLVRERWERRIA